MFLSIVQGGSLGSLFARSHQHFTHWILSTTAWPCLCLSVPVSVFVAWRKKGLGGHCWWVSSSKTTKPSHCISISEARAAGCILRAAVASRFPGQMWKVILWLLIFTFVLIPIGYSLPITLNLVQLYGGQGNTLRLRRVGMMVWQATGTDKCDLICPLPGLNLSNQDECVQQQFVTSLSGLSRLSPNQGQWEKSEQLPQKAKWLEKPACDSAWRALLAGWKGGLIKWISGLCGLSVCFAAAACVPWDSGIWKRANFDKSRVETLSSLQYSFVLPPACKLSALVLGWKRIFPLCGNYLFLLCLGSSEEDLHYILERENSRKKQSWSL